jgi:hypothetical protein
MKSFLALLLSLTLYSSHGQEFSLPELNDLELSPKIQSPLYQTFDRDEFDLLVKNVNVFASPKRESAFDFVEASTMKQRRYTYQNFHNAVNRQMSQYSDFKIEINNYLNNPFMDYNDEPIYSGLNRVRNAAYQDARNLTGFRGYNPLLYSPSLSARRGLIWY